MPHQLYFIFFCIAGLIALVVLFPYNAFRTQVDRSLGRLEMLIAAAASGL